jgi:hypothetical protein
MFYWIEWIVKGEEEGGGVDVRMREGEDVRH